MFVSDVTPRFKVQIRVQDDTGSVSLVLMDRDVQTLLNTTTSKLLDDIDQAEDFELFPKELDVLVGKKFVFLVELSKYNIDFNFHVYTIKKLTDDTETTRKFQDSPNLMQESMSESDLNFSHENSVKGKLEQKIGNSVSGENNVIDLDNSCTKKRHFDVKSSDARRIDFEKEEELVAKGSSSKMSLKVPKIEKS